MATLAAVRPLVPTPSVVVAVVVWDSTTQGPMDQAGRVPVVVAVARAIRLVLARVVWESLGKVRTVRRGQVRASLVAPAAVPQQ